MPDSPTTRPSRPLRPWVLLALALVLVAALPHSVVSTAHARPSNARRVAAEPPNIVLILSDDQRWDTLGPTYMPFVQSELMDHGITFTNAFVVNSLCCPSRASILTGAYSHTTQVYSNTEPYGGFRSFTGDGNTIATWLHGAGYHTALVGKYLNEYNVDYIPPGWDRWVAFDNAPAGGAYYDYTLDVDHTLVSYDHADADYSTDVLAGYADSFIRTTDPAQPLFLYFAVKAPHFPSTPATKYATRFKGLAPLRPPNYNEADVSDKPAWVQSLPLLTTEKMGKIDRNRKNQFRSMLSVDDAVNTIMTALTDTGRLSNTLVLYMSDNGWSLGEHRWNNKEAAYEESIRVPMIVRYDPLITAPGTNADLVTNIDVAPTFAAAAGVQASGAEGLNMLPLFTDPSAPWRHDFLIENLYHPPRDDPIPTFCAVRDDALQPEGYLYVLYSTGEEELYDLKNDVYELQNVVTDPTHTGELEYLRAQEALLCTPPPPGWPPRLNGLNR